MLRIRLTRTGKKGQPSYRVVVADKRSKRDGRIVERIGHYNPRQDPIEYVIREDRALHWLNVGAQPSDAVRRLLDKQGTFERLQRLRKGETLEALVAEYEGAAAAEEPAAEAAAEAEEAVAVEEAVDETEAVDEAAVAEMEAAVAATEEEE